MTTEPCEACGQSVHIAGGVANLWELDAGHGGGMTLELEDGTERFLCFECVEALPEETTRADIDSLDRTAGSDAEPTEAYTVDESGVSAAIPAGLTVGAVVGAAVGFVLGDVESAAWLGATVGVLVGLAWP